MRVASIESIINQTMLSMELSVHYYVQIGAYVMDVLRELDMDILERTKSVRAELDEFAEYALPADFVEPVMVAREVGNHLRPLANAQWLNTKILTDDGTPTGTRINYPSTPRSHTYYTSFGDEGYYSTLWYNAYGENLGRLFGIGAFDESNTWAIDKERGVLAIYPPAGWVEGSCVHLEYLYWDYANVHSVVTEYAARTVQAYAEWQYKKTTKYYSRFDVQMAEREYQKHYRVLRARQSALTINDFRRRERKYRRPAINW